MGGVVKAYFCNEVATVAGRFAAERAVLA